MPIGYPGNAISKEARAKAGGGFESAIEDVGGGASPFFEDSFESVTTPDTSDGSIWSWYNRSIDSDFAFSGSSSASLTFGPDASGADSAYEMGFAFGKELLEVWVEYYLRIPDNYFHRSESGFVSNNKFFQFNYNGSTYQALTVELVSQGDGTSGFKRFLAASEDPSDGSDNWPTSDTGVANIIGPGSGYVMQPGNWHQVRLHFKSSTNGTAANGYAAVYVDGNLIKDLAWPYWKISTAGKINGGYILGAANSGYTDATEFRVDSFRAFDTDPGWAA